jgi:ribonuclease HI
MRTARAHSQYTEEPITIYTDGSSSAKDGSGGWAFTASWVSLVREKYGSEASGATNITMELTAILRALEFVRPAPKRRLIVLTDSEWSIHALTKWWTTWKANGWKTSHGKQVANLDLLMQTKAAMKYHRSGGTHLTFGHVRGHTGVRGNERADTLAGEARRQGLLNWDEKTDAKFAWCATSRLYTPHPDAATPIPKVLRGGQS